MTAALHTARPITARPITARPITARRASNDLFPPRSAPRRRPTAATYRRRRACVGIALAVVVAVGSVAAHDVLAGSGGDPASAAASQPAHVRTEVIAQPGDTLWSIASAHHGDVSITRYLDTLVDLNGGPTIQVGQTIVLP